MTQTIWNIIEITNVVLEMFIIALYFSKLLKPRYEKSFIMIIAYVLSAAALSAVVLLYSQPLALFAVTAVALTALVFTVYEGRVMSRIYFVIIYLMIILIADPLLMGILYVLNLGNPSDFLSESWGRIIGMLLTKIMYMWMVIVITRVLMKKVRELPLKYWVSIILMPVISVVILYGVALSMLRSDTTRSLWVNVASIVGIIYLNIAMFNSFENYSKQIKLTFLETASAREAENYKLIQKSYQDMRKLRHDFKNEVDVLNRMIAEKKYESAGAHIAEIADYVEKTGSVCYTGNEAIDSLINIKGNTARESGIRFITKMNVHTAVNANSLELCRIIGNALDNAAEACCRVEAEDRFICISINEIDDKLMIEITNTSAAVDTDDLSTTKSDRRLHGYGIQSIKSSVQRLDGILNLSYSDGVFTLKLLVKNFD